MHQHFGIIHAIPRPDARLSLCAFNHHIRQTLDRPALIANKMGMLMPSCPIADAIAPDLVIAPHTMEEFFAGKGVKRAIERDVVRPRGKLTENLRSAQRRFA